jgi:hypothetical protein
LTNRHASCMYKTLQSRVFLLSLCAFCGKKLRPAYFGMARFLVLAAHCLIAQSGV